MELIYEKLFQSLHCCVSCDNCDCRPLSMEALGSVQRAQLVGPTEVESIVQIQTVTVEQEKQPLGWPTTRILYAR